MKYNLSEAEYEIMKFIWEQGDNIGFNDIMEYTQKKGHTWKKQTVQTFLTRLIDKGVLKAEKVGNKRYYSPSTTETEHICKWTHWRIIEKLYACIYRWKFSDRRRGQRIA